MSRAGQGVLLGLFTVTQAMLAGCGDDGFLLKAVEGAIRGGGGPHHPSPMGPPPGPPIVGAGGGGGLGDLGAGGIGAPPPPICPVFVPETPLLTGSAATVAAPGSIYSYAVDPSLAAPTATPFFDAGGVWQGIQVVASPGVPASPAQAFVGFGVPVFGCVDASAYRGIAFDVTGDLGTCALSLMVVARNDNAVAYGGACTATACFGPTSAALAVGHSVVQFTDLAGGSPNPTLDATQINDISWQLAVPADGVTPPCAAKFSVQNIAFAP